MEMHFFRYIISHDQFDKALISNTAGSKNPLFSSIAKWRMSSVSSMITLVIQSGWKVLMNTGIFNWEGVALFSRTQLAVLIYISQETVRTVEDIFLIYRKCSKGPNRADEETNFKGTASKALIEEIFVATLLETSPRNT
jgi:hypothetical protein